MNILGISCFYHDAAACLMKNGRVVAAAEEERFTRKKHDFDFPNNAVEYCLREGNISIDEVDYVGFEIPNKFVVGYGLDYGQIGRPLRDVYIEDS